MALTYTPAGELGSPCPDFDLLSVDGISYQNQSFAKSKVLAVAFICNHCPYVKAIEDRFIKIANAWPGEDVQWIAICSNDSSEYPEDAPGELLKRWKEKKYGMPYLVDERQAVAKAFNAVCTPDFFVYDNARKLRYRGRLDDSWKNPEKVQKQELKEAIDNLLAGRELNSVQNPAMGCSIKWKSGTR